MGKWKHAMGLFISIMELLEKVWRSWMRSNHPRLVYRVLSTPSANHSDTSWIPSDIEQILPWLTISSWRRWAHDVTWLEWEKKFQGPFPDPPVHAQNTHCVVSNLLKNFYTHSYVSFLLPFLLPLTFPFLSPCLCSLDLLGVIQDLMEQVTM